MYYSKKDFGNDRGLSCCFRQWRATHSHCSQLHGYSIGVKFVFTCDELDDKGWVFDFGAFKPIKAFLEETFDHTVLVARDDPELQTYMAMNKICKVVVLEHVGCEAFAKYIYDNTTALIKSIQSVDPTINPTAYLRSVEVYEHGANSAVYVGR